jgi:histidinol-phosphatase
LPSRELTAALDAARAASVVIQRLYQRNLAITLKADRSPVTEADVQAERAIRAVLEPRFPGYGFYGEETGQHAMDAENVWLVDPIDGTKSFVRDCPFFSTQIALLRAGRLVLGVSCASAYGELACHAHWQRFGALVGRVNRLRGYGDFVHYHLLARGALDAVIESDVNILDIAALTVIVREAGGRFTQLDGQPVTLGTTTVLATNGALHADLLTAVGG